jgi:hypothetical protein
MDIFLLNDDRPWAAQGQTGGLGWSLSRPGRVIVELILIKLLPMDTTVRGVVPAQDIRLVPTSFHDLDQF